MRSWWALHAVLERWGPREGFYSLANAFPWGLLLLLRFKGGCFVGEVIRGGGEGSGSSGIDIDGRTEVLRVRFAADGSAAAVRVCGRAGAVDAEPSGPLHGALPLEWSPVPWTPAHPLARRAFEAPGLNLFVTPVAQPASLLGRARAALGGWLRPPPAADTAAGAAAASGAAAGELPLPPTTADDAAAAAAAVDADADAADAALFAAAAVAAPADPVQRVLTCWHPAAPGDPRELCAALIGGGGGGGAGGPGGAGGGAGFRSGLGALRLRAVEGPACPAAAIAFSADMPVVRPGLYAGAYGADYGQHRVEHLLVEYRRCARAAHPIGDAGCPC